MANVKDTRSKFHDKIGRGFDIPSEHVESEGERLIKCLAQKQINTKLKLTEELQRKNNFQKPTKVFPLTEFACGEVKLAKFKEINESVLNLEKLYASGLNKDEINLYADSLKGLEFMRNKYKNLPVEILNDRLSKIFEKVNNKTCFKKSTSNNNLHRQEYELGLCVKPDSKETKLYKFALTCQNTNNSDQIQPLEHPINNLKEIEQDLFKHLKDVPVPTIDKRRKRARKILEHDVNNSVIVRSNISECINEKNNKSKWDMQEIPAKKEKKIYTCALSTAKCYTIENEQLIRANVQHEIESFQNNSKEITKGVEFVGVSHSLISLEHIKKYKLSLEDIKKISKFSNYEPGIPNKVLFAKNLPSNLSENDLLQIFGNFEKPTKNKIAYKIMTGRMKGQAFITFPDEQQAKEALEIVNGYLLNGKPIILQYGRKIL